MNDLETDAADVVIVGGGTSGCALAARLSEDPGRSVLLLEEGPDDADGPESRPSVVGGGVVASP